MPMLCDVICKTVYRGYTSKECFLKLIVLEELKHLKLAYWNKQREEKKKQGIKPIKKSGFLECYDKRLHLPTEMTTDIIIWLTAMLRKYHVAMNHGIIENHRKPCCYESWNAGRHFTRPGCSGPPYPACSWNTSRDGTVTTSLGNLSRCLTILTGKNILLISNLNLLSMSLKPSCIPEVSYEVCYWDLRKSFVPQNY